MLPCLKPSKSLCTVDLLNGIDLPLISGKVEAVSLTKCLTHRATEMNDYEEPEEIRCVECCEQTITVVGEVPAMCRPSKPYTDDGDYIEDLGWRYLLDAVIPVEVAELCGYDVRSFPEADEEGYIELGWGWFCPSCVKALGWED